MGATILGLERDETTWTAVLEVFGTGSDVGQVLSPLEWQMSHLQHEIVSLLDVGFRLNQLHLKFSHDGVNPFVLVKVWFDKRLRTECIQQVASRQSIERDESLTSSSESKEFWGDSVPTWSGTSPACGIFSSSSG